MAGGRATSVLLEFEPVVGSGTFVDISSYVTWVDGVRITQGRQSEFDEIQAGSMAFTLVNSTGNFTPDNPLGSWFPNFVEGRRIRFSVTKGASTSRRFYGRLATIDPQFPDGDPANAVVQVVATDILADLQRRVFRCDFVERWLYSSRTGTTVDLFPLDTSATDPLALRSATGGSDGAIVLATTGAGTVTMEQQPDGVVLDAAVSLTSVAGVGPIVTLPLDNIGGGVVELVVPFRTSEAYNGVEKWLASGLTSVGAVAWSVRMVESGSVPGQTDISLYNDAGVFVASLCPAFAPSGAVLGDDRWYLLRMFTSGVNFFGGVFPITANGAFYSWGALSIDISSTRTVVLGGKSSRTTPGKQTNCLTARFGAVAASSVTTGHAGYLRVNTAEAGQTRAQDLALYSDCGLTVSGTANASVPNVMLKQLSGRAATDCVNELSRTLGAVIVANYSAGSNALLMRDSDVMRRTTVVATFDAEGDVDASNGLPLKRGSDQRPTRVTATWPGGSVTAYGDESQQRIDESVETTAASAAVALSVASARLNRGVATRLAGLQVDLVTATTDLYATVFALKPGDRVRLNNLPTALIGLEWLDAYVQGWTETWSIDSSRFEFDTTPADAPAQGIFDDDLRGRFCADPGSMTVTGGTAVGGTGNGTIVVTTAGGSPPFTTTPGAYPLRLDWNGERVTITSAPASSTSPQTLTITARGVDQTVARVHATGEPIDVAQPVTFAF